MFFSMKGLQSLLFRLATGISIVLCISPDGRSQGDILYFNNFDTPEDTIGWNHYATSGTDDWHRGVPSNPGMTGAFTDPWAWYQSVGDEAAVNSVRYLETPIFDLSVSDEIPYLFFRNKRSVISGTQYSVQYSTDGVNWMTLDNVVTKKKNWDFTIGTGSFAESAVSLDMVAGETTVRFRFRIQTGINAPLGWSIDNFGIAEEYYDLVAGTADPVVAYQNCTDLEVTWSFQYVSPYSLLIYTAVDFYLSEDEALDATDTLFLSDVVHIGSAVSNDYTIESFDPGAGSYFIIYAVDQEDNISEADPANNTGVIPLQLMPVLSVPFYDDFEVYNDLWQMRPDANDSIGLWEYGHGYAVGSHTPHSGANAWHISRQFETSDDWIDNLDFDNLVTKFLYSPQFDLGSVNEPVCMSIWCRNMTMENMYGNSYLNVNDIHSCDLDILNNAYDLPAYTSEIHPGWRFFTRELDGNDLDATGNTGFVFKPINNDFFLDRYQMALDDFYVGPLRADLSVECDKRDQYIRAENTIQMFHYDLTNSGLVAAPVTVTRFYASSDSLYDDSDVLLGEMEEEMVPAGWRSPRTFSYAMEPDTGIFYLFYILDALNDVLEMREYNDTGFVHISSEPAIDAPYFNDLESDIAGWYHNSSVNEDEVEWDSVGGDVFPITFSGERAWMFGDQGALHTARLNHLYTPVFDISDMEMPVVEFDMIYEPSIYDQTPNDLSVNLQYSLNGGSSWTSLPSEDFTTGNADLLLDYGWEGFDYSDQVNSLEILQNHFLFAFDTIATDSLVRFRFNLAVGNMGLNSDTLIVKGILIDNFAVSEGRPDLTITPWNLGQNAGDDQIRVVTNYRNQGNVPANNVNTKFYLSVDSLWDESDFLLDTFSLSVISPYTRSQSRHTFDLSALLEEYNYVICWVDPDDLILESDESNNFMAAWINGEVQQYPFFDDFQSDTMNGWIPESPGGYDLIHSSAPLGRSPDAYNGLDDPGSTDFCFQSRYNINSPYVYWLDSPEFDFSAMDSIRFVMEIGMDADYDEGVNLWYSADDLETWHLIETEDAAGSLGMVNWYSEALGDGEFTAEALDELDMEPGWHFHDTVIYVEGNFSHLRGQPEIVFRIAGTSGDDANIGYYNGWWVDDVLVEAFSADYEALDSLTMLEVNSSDDAHVDIAFQVLNGGETNGRPSRTMVYWSDDAVFEPGADEWAGEYFESNFPQGLNEVMHEVPLPVTLQPGLCYLFYVLDSNGDLNETDELNNTGSFQMDLYELVDYSAGEYQEIFGDHTDPTLDIEYSITNPGTADGEETTTAFYWSEDASLDENDSLFAEVIQPSVAHQTTGSYEVQLDYPLPLFQTEYSIFYRLDESELLDEYNEENNTGRIDVNFTYWSSLNEIVPCGSSRVYYNAMDQCIHLIEFDHGSVDLYLRDATGRLINRFTVHVVGTEVSVEISSGMTSGIYSCQLSGNGSNMNFQFLVP